MKNSMSLLTILSLVSAVIAILINLIITTQKMGTTQLPHSLFLSTLLGVVLVPKIQKITGYCTSYNYGAHGNGVVGL